MKARAICRLLGVLAVLAAWVGVSAVVRTSAQAHATGRVLPGAISYAAEGGEPTPPPLLAESICGLASTVRRHVSGGRRGTDATSTPDESIRGVANADRNHVSGRREGNQRHLRFR